MTKQFSRLAVFAFPFVIYWPLVAFPYLLMDDNWLARDWAESGYPSFGFISAIQGRPMLALMAWGSANLIHAFGFEGIQLFHLLGIAGLGICGVLLYQIAARFPVTHPYRLLMAALWMTLPATQVMISDGTWLTVGLAAGLGAVLLLLLPFSIVSTAGAVVLLLVAASTYQPLFFAAVAVYLLTLYQGEWRRAVTPLTIIGASGLAYYVLWKAAFVFLFPGSGEDRYNPGSLLSLAEWPTRLANHFNVRFGMLRELWDVPLSFPSISEYVQPAVIVLVLVAAWRCRNPRWLLLIPVALIVSDLAVLPSKNWVFSYSTMIGASIVIAIVISGTLSYAFRENGFPVIPLLTFFGIIAAISAARHFAIPTWLDAKLIQRYAETIKSEGYSPMVFCYVGDTHIYTPGTTDPAYGVQEFTWSNTGPFYAYWHTRTLLDIMGRNSKNLVVVIKDPMKNEVIDIAPAGTSPTIVGECETNGWADFSVQTKHDLFR